MSRYEHKIESYLEGIEHLSKEKKEEKEINSWEWKPGDRKSSSIND